MSTIILTDSTSDIELSEAEKAGINVLPLTVTFGEESFIDGQTLTKKEFYKKQAESKTLPVTSQINPEGFLSFFEKCKANNDQVVYIGLSSKLSGTFQSAVIAKQMCNYEGIYLVDSLSASLGEHILVLKACQMRDSGKTGKEIAEFLQSKANKIKIYAAVDTLRYLIKGGRVSKAAGTIGGVLNLKPIITLKDGEIVAFEKARGRQKAFEVILKQIQTANIDTDIPMVITHAGDLQAMFEFEDFLKEKGIDYNWQPSQVGCVIGAHTGPGCVGVAFCEK